MGEQNRETIQGIIFDRDGTLFDSLPLILRSFQHGIEPFTPKKPTQEEWFRAFGPAERDVLGAFITPDHKNEAFQRFYQYYTEHFEEVTLFPGIKELLYRLKESKVRIMLFTGGGRKSTEFCLKKEKILSYFDGMVTGEDVMHPKPDPEGVIHLIRSQQLSAEQTLVVGDAPADIEAGQKAGAITVLARWSENAQHGDLAVTPDHIFYSVQSFEEFLFPH